MVHTGMVGMVVCGGDKERDVQSTAPVLNEIGVGGLSVEVATDNEAALKSLVERGLAASSARGYHWRNISEARPQAKGIERAVCIMKERIYANWLALERHCNARIALQSPFWDIWWDMSTGRTPVRVYPKYPKRTGHQGHTQRTDLGTSFPLLR